MRTIIKRRLTWLGAAAYVAVVSELLLGAPFAQACICHR
jgi:hypothetical protein